MKSNSNILKAVSALITILVVISGCSTTRKTDTQIQQRTSAASDIDRQTNHQSNKESAVNTSETDLSNIIIDFTKVEYADNPSPSTTNDSSDINQVNQIWHYGLTELPIKSVLLGRATINNNKRTKTDELTTSADESQLNESGAITTTTQTATSQKTEEKPKRTIFRIFASVSLLSIILFVGYEYWRRKKD